MSRLILSCSALVLCASLTACGGSVSDPAADPATPVAETEVPESAVASVTAFVQYLLALVERAPSESDEALSLDKIGVAPGSDTDEPTTLN